MISFFTAEQLKSMTKAQLMEYWNVELIPAMNNCVMVDGLGRKQTPIVKGIYNHYKKDLMIVHILRAQETINKYTPVVEEMVEEVVEETVEEVVEMVETVKEVPSDYALEYTIFGGDTVNVNPEVELENGQIQVIRLEAIEKPATEMVLDEAVRLQNTSESSAYKVFYFDELTDNLELNNKLGFNGIVKALRVLQNDGKVRKVREMVYRVIDSNDKINNIDGLTPEQAVYKFAALLSEKNPEDLFYYDEITSVRVLDEVLGREVVKDALNNLITEGKIVYFNRLNVYQVV